MNRSLGLAGLAAALLLAAPPAAAAMTGLSGLAAATHAPTLVQPVADRRVSVRRTTSIKVRRVYVPLRTVIVPSAYFLPYPDHYYGGAYYTLYPAPYHRPYYAGFGYLD